MAPQICVSIGRTRHRMMIAEHQALAQKGAELIELRLDFLSRPPDLTRLLKDRPTPVVATCRRAVDRGQYRGTEEQRQTLLRAAILAGVEYVDIEDDIAKSIRRYGKTKRIVSHHDFEKTPDNLEKIHAEMCGSDPDVVKIVTMAHSAADCRRMLELVRNAKVPTVGFCMGEFGTITRILCGIYGAPWTYATFSKERELAPGQLSFDEMRKLYRFERINTGTKIFGVLGDPVAHSLSPLLHNIMMRKSGFDGVYMPLRVPADQLSAWLDDFEKLGLAGYSVTIPHKEAILSRCTECAPSIKAIGAANTLYRNADNKWTCANTDYSAALEAIQSGLKEGDTLEGKRVIILGAGGAARAIAKALVDAQASVVITNRTSKRATVLAQELGVRAITWENRGAEFADILVNCTPVGMHPNLNDSPFPAHLLRDEMLVFDTIYTPEQTLLIKEARERGCKTVTGVEMFVRQAAAQFTLFTGETPSMDLFREVLRRIISPAKFESDAPTDK